MAGELWRYLDTTTANYTAEQLKIFPDKVMPIKAGYPQSKIEYDNNKITVISFGEQPKILVGLQFNQPIEVDRGTIQDLYLNYAKARGQARTFEWVSPDIWPVSGYIYIARFWSESIESLIQPVTAGFSELKLFLEGYKTP